jgi:hypothetical protein
MYRAMQVIEREFVGMNGELRSFLCGGGLIFGCWVLWGRGLRRRPTQAAGTCLAGFDDGLSLFILN